MTGSDDDTSSATASPLLERVWLCYLACVVTVALLTPGGGSPDHDPVLFVLVHVPVLLAVLGVRWLVANRSPNAVRTARAVLGVVALPAVFSALCWLLPAVHPEPYEYVWLAVDRWLFGADIARIAELPPFWVELLQVVYALFYSLCIAAVLAAGICGGRHALDRATLLIVGGFLSSYLGYLLVPTIAPKLVLAHTADVEGLWLTATLRGWIDGAETNHWDCFPSGHTMMTVVSLIVMRRWAPKWFRVLLVPSLLLIASTMLLRYHWASDVIAGGLWALSCVRLLDWLADRDGWPAVDQTSLK